MAWNKKKILAKIGSYFENKNISYQIKEESIIEIELFFKDSSFVLYPYLTIDQSICSVNINVSKHPLKGFNYELLNRLNQKSKFFKAFITQEGIVALEYRFILNDLDFSVFDAWIDSLFLLEDEMNLL